MVYRNRREFLKQSACGAAAFGLAGRGLLSAAPEEKRRPRIAAIYTELREFSHAYHILEPHMGPYLFNGKLTDPGVDVVSFYCDQYPENDMTREASARLNMPMYDTIAEALTCGGDTLAVDGVLLIGEHGNYPKNELGQVMYPRKEFFDQIVAVFRRTGRSVPVFNDKHLSYRWDWAKEMYDTAQEMGFPLMAGSSVPLAPRVPAVEFPTGAEVVEAVSIHGGGMESYDFHALEVMQSMIEFRKGGETGISDVQLLTREPLMQAAEDGLWSRDLFEVAMQTELDHRTDTGLKGPGRGNRAGSRIAADIQGRTACGDSGGARHRRAMELRLPAQRAGGTAGNDVVSGTVGQPEPVPGALTRDPAHVRHGHAAVSGRADTAGDRRARCSDAFASRRGRAEEDAASRIRLRGTGLFGDA